MSPTDGESAVFWICVSDDKDKRLAELASDLSSAREAIAQLRRAISFACDGEKYLGADAMDWLCDWNNGDAEAMSELDESLRSSRTKGETL